MTISEKGVFLRGDSRVLIPPFYLRYNLPKRGGIHTRHYTDTTPNPGFIGMVILGVKKLAAQAHAASAPGDMLKPHECCGLVRFWLCDMWNLMGCAVRLAPMNTRDSPFSMWRPHLFLNGVH